MKKIQAVLKVSERCNINCTYCYYFNGKDQTYKERPAKISLDTVKNVALFLVQGAKEAGVKKIHIGLHGGEPLLLTKPIFDNVCALLRETIEKEGGRSLTLALQTNGTLIDDEWVNLFHQHKIHVGVSLDGPEEVNDKNRVDFFGRGTYHRVARGLSFLKKGVERGKISGYGVLSVMNPRTDATTIFNHFVHDLKVKSFDLLWPDYHHDRPPPEDISLYGKFIADLFHRWVKADDPQIRIRFLRSVLDLFVGKQAHIYGIGPQDHDCLPLITIYSDGTLYPTDELQSTDPSFKDSKQSICTISYQDYVGTRPFLKLKKELGLLPLKCRSCVWMNVCGGGGMVNRYSAKNGFQNPSVYCDALKTLYQTACEYLLENGLSQERIEKILFTPSAYVA